MISEEYLNEIRTSPGLERAVLKKIVVERGEAAFFLVTDVNYTAEDIRWADEVSARYARGLKASARVVKSVPDAEGIRRALYDALQDGFPAVSAFVSPAEIRVDVGDRGGAFHIAAAGNGSETASAEAISDALSASLMRSFCGVWTGEIVFRAKDTGEIERDLPPEEFMNAPRFFAVTDYDAIDGGAPERAIYIADLGKEMQGVCVCGSLVRIEERETRNGKPFFSLAVSDGTGTLRAAYFSKQKTIEKVRDLRQGMNVCLTGDMELFNGALSFRVKAIDRGAPPEGFVPEQLPSRPVPARYRAVFPVPEANYVQSDFFGLSPLPDEFNRETFVVFDLETTGYGQGSGTMDRIIEVGAVKRRERSLNGFPRSSPVPCVCRRRSSASPVSRTTCSSAHRISPTSLPTSTSSPRAVRSLRTILRSTASSSAITGSARATFSIRNSLIR